MPLSGEIQDFKRVRAPDTRVFGFRHLRRYSSHPLTYLRDECFIEAE